MFAETPRHLIRLAHGTDKSAGIGADIDGYRGVQHAIA
jgi:hypothetical protein